MDDSSENKLKNRLYMNFSHASLSKRPLQGNEQLKGQQRLPAEVLVPKIYAESHRRSDGFDRSLASLRGKLVLQKQQYHLKESQKKRVTPLATKEPMQPIEQNELTEEARTLVRKQKGLHKKQRFNKELVMNLAPRNIFSFFENYPEMHLDFFYLNKYSHPYDYRIVDFNERNPDEYMTISCKGVTQFIQKEAHFLTREEWMAEEDMYEKLQHIDFFSKYKLNKNFRIWKNMMKRHYMKEMSNLLNSKLFAASNSQPALLSIKRHCLELEEECKMLSYETHSPERIEEFETQVARHQTANFMENVRRFQRKIVQELVHSIEQSVEAYKEENNLVDQREPDGKAEESPKTRTDLKDRGSDCKNRTDYSKEALLRMHYVKIARFVKLVDAMLLEAKTTMMLNNLQQLLDVLTNINIECGDDWLLCQASWNGSMIAWTPDRNRVKDAFSEITNNALKLLAEDKFTLDQQPDFQQYLLEDDKPDLRKEERATIRQMCRMSEDYNRRRSEIAEELDVAFDRVQDEQLKMMVFANIYERHQQQSIALDKLNVYEVRKVIEEFCEDDQKMETMPEKVELGLLLLDFTDLRKRIRNAPAHSHTQLLEALPKLLQAKSERLGLRIQEFISELAQPPAKVESFVSYTKSVNRASECLDELTSSSAELNELMFLMEQLKLGGLDKYRQKVRGISSSVALLKDQIQKSNASYDTNLGNFRKELQAKVKTCEATLKTLQDKYSETPLCSRDSDIDSMLEFLQMSKPQVELMSQQAEEVNYLETELSLDRTSFEKIVSFHREFKLVEQLWLGRKHWRDMIRDIKDRHFLQVDHIELRSQYDEAIRQSCMLLREIGSNEVTKVFYEEVQTFELVIATLAALHDPHLREKHEWQEIPRFLYHSKNPDAEQTSVDPELLPLANINDPIYTVNWIILEEIYLYREQLAYFGIKAAREQELANTLKAIGAYLSETELQLVKCNDGKEGIMLGNNEQLFAKIDENLMMLNSIMASKYVDNLRFKVEVLMRQFRYLQELFDEMLLHQQNWLYLEPLLSSTSNASKFLPKESKEFLSCDGAWRRAAKTIRDNPSLSRIVDDMTNGNYIRRTLSKNNANFEQIRKLLDDYVEKKRALFPRFYFLPTERVLDLLCKAKTPATLEPYLPLLFQHVRSFIHDSEQQGGILGIINHHDEQLMFKQFSLRQQPEAEEILKAMEEQMKKNLSQLMKSILPRYEEESISRMQLLEEFPYQVASGIDWLLWTKFTEEYLDPECLSDIAEWRDLQIQQIVELATKLQSKKLTSNRSRALSCLMLQSIYMRQRTQLLQREKVGLPTDYHWLSAVKFYVGTNGQPEIYMRQFNGRLPYGFEFQSIPETVVIAPQTERAWLGFHLAMEQRLFPNIHGPCESGKSETTKQLAGMLAQNLVVTNLNELTGLRFLERVLSGMTMTGSWVTFKYWEKLRPELLSVLAGLLFNIKRTLMETKDVKDLKDTKDKEAVNLYSGLNAFFPSLTQVPSGNCLAALFRPVSIVGPPLGLVVKGLLQARGFSGVDSLTDYIVKIIQFCGTVLKVTSHSRYGLKVARKLIETMDSVNTEGVRADEIEKLLGAAVQKVIGINLEHGAKEQLSSFMDLLFGTFSNNPLPTQECPFEAKVVELVESVGVKPGTIVVGSSQQGKSAAIKEAAKRAGCQLNFINHKCYSSYELVGDFQGSSGIMPMIIKAPTKSWVVLDGNIQETQGHLLDLLQAGQSTQSWELLFEADGLVNVPPSLLWRTTIVTVQGIVTVEDVINRILERELKQLIPPELLKALSQHLSFTLRRLLVPKRQFSLLLRLSELAIARSCCHNLVLILKQLSLKITDKDMKDMRRLIDRLTVWAVAWGLGSIVTTDTMDKFETVLSESFKLDNFPPRPIHEHCLNGSLEWVTWQSRLPNLPLNPSDPFEQLMVWTDRVYCCSFFVRGSIDHQNPLMLTGQSGSGKSRIVRSVLNHLTFEENSLTRLYLTLSASTKPAAIQSLMEERLQNQRQNGQIVAMPPPGKKLLVQVDDLSLDGCNNTTFEALRQQISHKGMFDRRNFGWKATQDVSVGVVAREPSTQGVDCHRFFNLFNLFVLREDYRQLRTIFSSLLKTWLKQASFNDDLSRILSTGKLADITIQTLMFCRMEVRETTNVQHLYLLNYTSKDVFRVFQSISRIECGSFTKIEQFARLWINEILRVLSDRLADKTAKEKLQEFLKKQVFVTFKYDMHETFFKQPMLYGKGMDSDNYSYLNYESTCLNLREKMIELSPKFSLLLFKELVEHIVHLVRGLGVKQGHFLLVGPRASGKRSIVQLACFVAKVSCELELEGAQRLLKCFMQCIEGNESCLYINDSSLLNPEQLHQVNCILNQTLCPFESSNEMNEKMAGLPSESPNQSISERLLQAVYQKLHVVVAASPSPFLRDLLLENPQLVTSCTTDFITHWPDEALYEVAEVNLSVEIFQKDQKAKMARIAGLFHRAVEDAIEKHKLPILLSPRRYLQLISLFSFKYQVRNEESNYVIGKVQKCLDKYSQIVRLHEQEQASLKVLEQALKGISVTSQKITETIESRKTALEEYEAEGESEEESQAKLQLTSATEVMRTLVQSLRSQCENLNITIKQEMKSLEQPSFELVPVKTALSAMLNIEATESSAYDVLLLAKLKTLQREEIFEKNLNELISALEIYASTNAQGEVATFIEWLNEFCKIGKSILENTTHREQLKGSPIARKRVLLADELMTLEISLASAKQSRSAIDTDVKQSRQKIRLCKELQERLDEDHKQWVLRLQSQTSKLDTLLSDLFFACSAFSYLGPFGNEHRQEIMDVWKIILEKEKAPFSKLDFADTLFDELEIQSLKTFTHENLLSCLMMIKSAATPYLLDPDQIATDYLRSIYPEMRCLRFDDDNFLPTLQRYVKEGATVLLEYNKSTIEPCLQPLLGRGSLPAVGNKRVIKLTDKPIEWHDSFKLFLCNRWREVIPTTDIHDNCCVINFNFTRQNLCELFQSMLLDQLAEHDQHFIEEENSRASDINISLKAKNEKILSLIEGIDFQRSSASITETLEELKKLEEKKIQVEQDYAQSKKKIAQLAASHSELKELAIQLSKLAWFSFYGLSSVAPSGGYRLANFKEVLRKAIEEYRIASSEPSQQAPTSNVHTILKTVAQTVKRGIERSVEQQHQGTLRLLLMLRVESISNRTHRYRELLEKVATQTSENGEILERLKTYEFSEDLLQKFQADESFKDWLNSVNLANLAVNVMYGPIMLSPIQRLLLLKARSPSNFPKALNELTETYFGERQQMNLQAALTISSDNRTPVCFLCSEVDPTIDILTLARDRKIPKDSIVVMNLNAEERQLERISESTIWLVLLGVKQKHLQVVEKLYQQIKGIEHLREDFRLVLVVARSEWNASLTECMKDKSIEWCLEDAPNKALEKSLQDFQVTAESNKYSQTEPIITALTDFYKRASAAKRGPGKKDTVSRAINDALIFLGSSAETFTPSTIRLTLLDLLDRESPDQHAYLHRLLKLCFAEHMLEDIAVPAEGDLELLENSQAVNSPTQQLRFIWEHENYKKGVVEPIKSERIMDLLSQLPHPIAHHSWQANDPIMCYLKQECIRYNTVLFSMKDDLSRLLKYIQYHTQQSCRVSRQILESLTRNEVPSRWHSQFILRKCDFNMWFKELRRNFETMKKWWMKEQRPRFLNINILFYPECFLQTVLQKWAKKMKIRIDRVSFSYRVLSNAETDPASSEFVINLADLYLKGCRYDPAKNCIEEIHSEGDSKLGIVQIVPIESQKTSPAQTLLYNIRIPIYRSEQLQVNDRPICHVEVGSKKKPEYWENHAVSGYCQKEKSEPQATASTKDL